MEGKAKHRSKGRKRAKASKPTRVKYYLATTSLSAPVRDRQTFDMMCLFVFGCYIGAVKGEFLFDQSGEERQLLREFVRYNKVRFRDLKRGPAASWKWPLKKRLKQGAEKGKKLTLIDAVRPYYSEIVKGKKWQKKYESVDQMSPAGRKVFLASVDRTLRRLPDDPRIAPDYRLPADALEIEGRCAAVLFSCLFGAVVDGLKDGRCYDEWDNRVYRIAAPKEGEGCNPDAMKLRRKVLKDFESTIRKLLTTGATIFRFQKISNLEASVSSRSLLAIRRERRLDDLIA